MSIYIFESRFSAQQALKRGVSLSNSIKSFNELFNRTLANIMTGHSFWRKTHGRDHVFLFMSEEGLDLIDESTWPLVRKSIFLTAPTQGGVSTAQRFDTFRDIVLPAYVPNFAQDEPTLSTERQVKVGGPSSFYRYSLKLQESFLLLLFHYFGFLETHTRTQI